MADELDLDAILQAQSSDGDDDQQEREKGLGSEALDRRLEEILNAAEDEDEEEEDDDDEEKEGGAAGFSPQAEVPVVESLKQAYSKGPSPLESSSHDGNIFSDITSDGPNFEATPTDASGASIDAQEFDDDAKPVVQTLTPSAALNGTSDSPDRQWKSDARTISLESGDGGGIIEALMHPPPAFIGAGANRPGAALAAAALASRQASTPHSSVLKPQFSSSGSLTIPKSFMPTKEPEADAESSLEPSSVEGRQNISLEEIKSSSLSSSLTYRNSDATEQVKENIGVEGHKRSKSLDDDEFIVVDTSFPTQTVVSNREGHHIPKRETFWVEKDTFGSGEKSSSLSTTSDSSTNEIMLNSDNDTESGDGFEVISSDDNLNDESILSGLAEEGFLATNDGMKQQSSAHTQKKFLLEKESPKTPNISKVRESEVKSQKSTLDMAEETEKKAAFSGLYMEEGAAAHPMQLEGIQTGPPPIGCLHIDSMGFISQASLSLTNSRDHGSGQSLAVHNNHIAVGLSKGSILLVPVKSNATRLGDSSDTKMITVDKSEKTYASVTSMSFNMQGDLLLVGHSDGSLVLCDVPRAVIVKVLNVDHKVAIVHTAFLGQNMQVTRYPKAVSADCKGLVLLHTFTIGGLLRRMTVTTQCLVDGQNTGMVLCLSPLLLDYGSDSQGSSAVDQPSTAAAISTGLSSMMGGMVGGVVATGKSSDTIKRFANEGIAAEEAGGVIAFVTHQTILVVRLASSVEVCAKLSRPDSIRDGSIPYVAWRHVQPQSGISSRDSGNVNPLNSADQGNKHPSITASQVESQKTVDNDGNSDNWLMFALAWDKKVFILQLLKGECKIFSEWDLDSVACGIAWLEEQMVVVLTSKEELYLFTKEGGEVEWGVIECEEYRKGTALAYHTHILNSFGNPEKTYHNSLAARGPTLYLLGSSQLWRACLLPWQDRINALKNAGDWMGAFHIGMEVYDGRALGVIGLPKKIEQLQEAVAPALLDLLFAYIDEAFTYLALSFGNLPAVVDMKQGGASTETQELLLQAKEQYARVGGVAIEFCVHIRQTDMLFDRVFNKFCSAGQKGTFLELLEPYILKDILGRLAPEVMQALVEYYSDKGWVQRVEQCVLHMDIGSLDFNQVVHLCRNNGLYSALIYLFNKGLDDYKSPLEELLIIAQDVTKSNSRVFGYKLFVYLKYCFLGLAFPPGHGHIPSSRLPELRAELLQCILDDKPLSKSGAVKELPRSHQIIHPRLSYMLSFDLLATLEVLRCAFPEDGPLQISKGTEQNISLSLSEESEFSGIKSGSQLLQDIVDALIDILEWVDLRSTSGEDSHLGAERSHLRLSTTERGYILDFIAHYVASNCAEVSRVILAQIIEHLSSAGSDFAEFPTIKKDANTRRKEELLVRLINGVSTSEWDSDHTLDLALRAQFWQASACLLARKGNYVAALDSHLKDKDQPQNAFLFILDVLNSAKDLPETTLLEFRSSVRARLPELLQLSSEGTLVIILKHFSKEHKHILSDLAPYPPLLFEYLKQIMHARSGQRYASLPLSSSTPLVQNDNETLTGDQETAADGRVRDSLIGLESLPELLRNARLEFTNDMEELFVELLCKFDPKSVLKFLQTFEGYRLEHCLKLCQDYGITDAAAFLFERVGDVGSALSLVIADMDLHIHEMDLSIARVFARQSNVESENLENTEQFLKIPEIAATCSVMQVAIGLCQRNTWRMYPGESEALWFRLLDRFVDPLRKLHSAKRGFRRKRNRSRIGLKGSEDRMEQDIKHTYKWKVVMVGSKAVELMRRVLVFFMGEIVNGMMGYIPLSAIMDKLLSDNGNHEFRDFKGTILGMLGSYGYEQTILFTAKHVVEDDIFQSMNVYKRRLTRGYAPNSLVCCVCNNRLDKSIASDGSTGPRWKGTKSTTIDGTSRNGKVQDTKGTAVSAVAAVFVFLCGHSAHCSCMEVGVTNLKTDTQNACCPVCPRKMCISGSIDKKFKGIEINQIFKV